MEVLCFLFGMIASAYLSGYPLLFIFLLSYVRPSAVAVWSGWFLVGFFYFILHEYCVFSSARLDHPMKLQMSGTIISLPKINAKGSRSFDYQISDNDRRFPGEHIRLFCSKRCESVKQSEIWSFLIVIYPNAAADLRAKHIRWTGFVVAHPEYQGKEKSIRSWLMEIRLECARRLERTALNLKTKALLKALTIGITSDLRNEDWTLFRKTGTIHLMIISGAHIGLVAGLIFKGVRWIWVLIPRAALWMPAQGVAAIIGIMVSFLYAVVSGFGCPAQRAMITFSIAMCRYLLDHRLSPWQGLYIALGCILCLEPHAVLQPGFYLSFLAVLTLLFSNKRYCRQHAFLKYFSLQGACLFGLLPFTLYWFSYASLTSFFANSIAVPWVSIVIIPLGFLTLMCSTGLPAILLSVQNKSVDLLFIFLDYIDQFSFLNLEHLSFSMLQVVIYVVAGLFIFFFSSVADVGMSLYLLLMLCLSI